MSDNIETKKILYDNAAKGVQSQIERKKEIDSKTFNMLSVTLILLGLVIEFVNIGDIFNYNIDINMPNILILVLMFLIYIAVIVLSILIIIRYIIILKGKPYRTINPEMYIDKGEKSKNKDEILDDFLEELVKSEKANSAINEKQMKMYDTNGILVIIVVVMSIILNVGLNIIATIIVK